LHKRNIFEPHHWTLAAIDQLPIYRQWVQAYDPPPATQTFFNPAVQTMPREALHALQEERLRATLIRAWETVPFYRRKFEQAGATPWDFKTVADLANFPITTKDELRASESAEPPFGSHRGSQDWVRMLKSGGTTGKPPWVTPSWRDVVMEAEGAVRCWWRGGLRPGQFLISTFPNTIGGMLHFSPAVEMFSGAAFLSGGVLNDEGTARFVLGALQDIGEEPKVLMASPTLFRSYLHWCEVLKIPMDSLNWTACYIAAEPGLASKDVRRQYEEQVGCKVFDQGGTADVFTIPCSECFNQNGMHLAEDHVLYEVLDVETLKPVGPGQRGQALQTNLTKSVNISIRFDPDDIISYDDSQCSCGETHRRIRIWGRRSDMISIDGKVLLPSDVEAVIRKHSAVGIGSQFQLVRTGPKQERLVVRVERPTGSADAVKADLEKMLRTELVIANTVEMVDLASMSRNATGYKAPLVVNEPRSSV
jgi:phenylacetate-CoA ligase